MNKEFKSLRALHSFRDYVEEHTQLYAVDELGYPWCLVALEQLQNSISIRKSWIPAPQQSQQFRLEDFKNKVHLLREAYDYAFITKSKMRRGDPLQYENYLFHDIFTYLEEEGKRFIILEEPDADDMYNMKYVKSRYAAVTLPYEFLLPIFQSAIQPLILAAQQHYRQRLDFLFREFEPPENYAGMFRLLRKTYHSLFPVIPHILMLQKLLGDMHVKAVFGGMGTHYRAGLRNPFAVVEVGHDYISELTAPKSSQPILHQYYQEHLFLQRFFVLRTSTTGKLRAFHPLYLLENMVDYGAPEIRAYKPDEQTIKELKEKYQLGWQPGIFVLTNGWVNQTKFDSLIREISNHFPGAVILLRPHPTYDDPSRYRLAPRVHLVDATRLYDLISVSDVIITPPSSVIFEAYAFTDHLIVYLDEGSDKSKEELSGEIPFAPVIPLDDQERFVEHIRAYLQAPCQKKSPPGGDNWRKGLEKLLKRVESGPWRNSNEVLPSQSHERETFSSSGMNRGEQKKRMGIEPDGGKLPSKSALDAEEGGRPKEGKTKIVVVQGGFPSVSATFILDQMTGLINRGFNVENWSTYNPGETVIHEDVLKYDLQKKTKYLKIPPNSSPVDHPLWFQEFLRLNHIESLDDVQAFHIHYGANFNLLEPLFRCMDKLVLVSFHGYDASRYFRQHGDGCYQYLFERANLITTPTDHMKEELIRRGCRPRKIIVHHYGVDLRKFHFRPRNFEKSVHTVLSVARLVEKKGLEYSIKAFGQLKDKEKIQYQIIGEGPLRLQLENLIHELGIGDRVKLLGAKSKEDVAAVMSASDIFILASVTASDGDSEGLPVSLIEAQAMGIPVISTNHAGIPELVIENKTGFLVNERDIAALSDRMEGLIGNAQLRSSFSDKARQRVEAEFNIDTLNDRLGEYLRGVILEVEESDGPIRMLRDRLAEKGWMKKYDMYRSCFESVRLLRKVKNPALSVIVVSSKFHPLILESFQKLAEEKSLNYELIFVDNGAPTGELDSLLAFVDNHIKLNQNTGAYLARNVGAAFAKAPILLFLDDDAIPAPNLIKSHLQVFENYEAIAVRGAVFPKTDNPLNKIPQHYYLGDRPFPIFAEMEGNTSYLAKTFYAVGGWDDEIRFGHGGIELSFRLTQAEPDHRKQMYSPAPVIYHDYARSEDHLRSKKEKQNQSRERLRQKHPKLDAFLKSWGIYHKRTDLLITRQTHHCAAQTSMPLLSIVVPTFNRAEYLKDALNSALAQTYPNFEIVVVDDGSFDHTAQVVQGFASEKIHYFRREHSGAPATRNTCIEEARGDFLLWLDDDDILNPNALEEYYNTLSLHPEADIFYCYLTIRHTDGREELHRYPEWFKNTGGLLGRLVFANQFSHVALLIRRAAYEKLGGYNLQFSRAHDYELFVRIAQYGKLTLKLVEKPLVVYRFHDQGHLSGPMKGKDFRYEWKIIDHILDRYTLQQLFPDRDCNNRKVIADIYHSLGRRYLNLNCIPKAIEYFTKSLRLQSNDELAKSLVQVTQTENALKAKLRDLHNLARNQIIDKNFIDQIKTVERLLVPLADLEVIKPDGEDKTPLDKGGLVSIIVPCYKQADLLPEAVESVRKQTYRNWECIIVNDGSPDNTSEVANELIRKHPDRRIRLIETENGGLPKARNTGMLSARGEYLLPLDADDRIAPSFLQKTVAVLRSHSKLGFVYTDIQHFGLRNDLWRLPEFDAEAIVHKDNIACGCSLMKKAMWDEVGGYNEDMKDGYEDWDFWVGCIEKGWSGQRIPEALFYYRRKSESMLGTSNAKRTYLIARIILNHPKLYDPRKIALAEHTVIAYEQGLKKSEPPSVRKKPLTITYLINNILSVTGGNQTLLNQVNALIDRGHRVHIVTYSKTPDYFTIKANIIQVPPNEPMSKYIPKSDAVISTYFTNTVELTRINAPVRIYYAQGDQFIFEDETLQLSPELERKKKAMKEISKASYLYPGIKFVANSHNLANAVEKPYGRKADAVLPVCVDSSIFHPLSKEKTDGRVRILVVGPDTPGNEMEPLIFKGMGDIREALDQLSSKRNDFIVVRMSNTQPRIFRDFPCEFHIVPNDQLKTFLYGTADILVYASHYDSCPRPPMEAMASGAAVVCTETSGALEYCRNEENCLLVCTKSPSALCDAIERLMDDKILREKLVRGGFATAGQFPQKREWDELESLLHSFYYEVVEPRSVVKGLTSVVVALNNEQERTKECIQSIEKFTTSKTYEVILVSCNSGANSGKRIRKVIKGKQNYKLIEGDKNADQTRMRNQGMEAARGEYILLLENDVVVTENWLSGMLECLNSSSGIGIVGPMTNNTSGPQKVEKAGYASVKDLPEYAKGFREKYRHRRIPLQKVRGFCILFRRELVERIGLLDESFGTGNFEDDDFCLRAELAGYRNMIAGDVFIHHFGSRSFIGNKIDYGKSMKGNHKNFMEKWNSRDPQSAEGKKYLSLQGRETARLDYEKGQAKKAVDRLLAVIRLGMEAKGAYYDLAELLLDAKQYDQALGLLKQMPNADQDDRKYALLGYCQEGLANPLEAQKLAEQALSLNSSNALALNLKGILSYRKGEKDEAEKYFQRAADADPGFGEPHTNLGVIRWEENRKKEALLLFERGFILSPTFTDIRQMYHTVITEEGEFARAEQNFRAAQALHPFHRGIRFFLIDILLKQAKNEEAMEQVEQAMSHFVIEDGMLKAALEIRKAIGPQEKSRQGQGGRISLCMIIRDEENDLVKCLCSVKPVVDEMIVVDTGSTDRTKDIATALGAKIFDFSWQNDFSAARNFSMSQAKGDWILALDADEVISPLDYGSLLALTKAGSPKAGYSFVTRNYLNTLNVTGWTANDGTYQEEAGSGWIPSDKVRLFPRDRRICFENPVHEFVEPSMERNHIPIKKCSIAVHHYGKLNEKKEKKKGQDYFLLGKKKLEKSDGDIRSIRELAIQANILQRYEEAAKLWHKVLRIQPNLPEAHFNLTSIYMHLGKFQEASAHSKKALELDPHCKEAVLNYSVVEFSLGNIKNAISALESLSSRISEYPLEMALLSVAYRLDGEREKSQSLIAQIRKAGFNYDEYLQNTARNLIAQGRREEAGLLLEMTGGKEPPERFPEVSCP